MKPGRSALPLPRYVGRKALKSGWGYFFNVPTWARKNACPVRNEPLGTDYEAAVRRAETILLPAFDSWRTGGKSEIAGAVLGTLDWVFAEYRADRRFTKLDTKTKRNHEVGFRLSAVMFSGMVVGLVKRASHQSIPLLSMPSMKNCWSSPKPTQMAT